MLLKVLKNILAFAEGGRIISVVVNGVKCGFESTEKDKNSKEKKNIKGSGDYDINNTDGVLQVMDKNGHHFFDIEKISAIQMEM